MAIALMRVCYGYDVSGCEGYSDALQVFKSREDLPQTDETCISFEADEELEREFQKSVHDWSDDHETGPLIHLICYDVPKLCEEVWRLVPYEEYLKAEEAYERIYKF